MKKLPLHNDGFATVDDDIYEVAKHLHWHRHHYGYPRAHVRSTGYGKKDGHHIFLHALVMGDVPKNSVTDHINGDTLDNRRENLRFVNWTLSNLNKKNNHGVRWRADKKKWIITTTVAGKRFFGGYFDTEEQATAVARLIHASLVYYELTKGEESGLG